jgi:hypothetical protein
MYNSNKEETNSPHSQQRVGARFVYQQPFSPIQVSEIEILPLTMRDSVDLF